MIRNCQSLMFSRAHDWNNDEPEKKVRIIEEKRDPSKIQKISIIEIKDSFEKIKQDKK